MARARTKSQLLKVKCVAFASRSDGILELTAVEWLERMRSYRSIVRAIPDQLLAEGRYLFWWGGDGPISELRDEEAFRAQLDWIRAERPTLLRKRYRRYHKPPWQA